MQKNYNFFLTHQFKHVFWVLKLSLIEMVLLSTQGCGNTMPDLSDLVPFHSGKVENFNLLVLGQVQNLYKVNKNFVFYIFINYYEFTQSGS